MDCASASKYNEVSSDTRKKVKEYFKQGLSPSGAYNALMNELQEKYGSDFMKISSDRSLLPDYKSFQHVITECVRKLWPHKLS